MILPKERDPRFITIRRGGTLTDENHRLLASWAADCAEHVLHFFEAVRPDDPRPRRTIESTRAWARGEMTMSQARAAAGANAAARDLTGAARYAAYAAGQAVAVSHVAAHELGAAAYAIKAARAAAPPGAEERAGRLECRWQRDHLPDAIRDLVLDDQRLRNDICWSVFDEQEVCPVEYSTDDVREARRPLASLTSKSEKAREKLAPTTWQHVMLTDNLNALHLATALMDGEAAGDRSPDEIRAALDALASMAGRTEKAMSKFPAGTSQHTLQVNRLKALRVAEAFVQEELRGESGS